MSAETIECQLLVLGSWSAIVGVWMNCNASTWREDASNFDITRIHKTNQVFHYYIDTVFVEVAMITEAEEIELEALAFDHLDIRNITDDDIGKIGLTSDRTEARELWAVELDPVVVVLMLVDERLQHFWSIILSVHCLLVAKERESFFLRTIHYFIKGS